MRWNKYIHTHRNTYAIIPNIISSSLPGHSFFNHDIGFFMTETHLFTMQRYGAADRRQEPGLKAPIWEETFQQPSANTLYFGFPKTFFPYFLPYCPHHVSIS